MQNKFMAGLLLGASLLGLNGCATDGNYEEGRADLVMIKYRKIITEKRFRDIYQGYKITSENNDLFIEKDDATEKRKITNTPNVTETWAFFTKDSRYVFYRTTDENFLTDKYFVQPFSKDDACKEELSERQYTNFYKERFPE